MKSPKILQRLFLVAFALLVVAAAFIIRRFGSRENTVATRENPALPPIPEAGNRDRPSAPSVTGPDAPLAPSRPPSGSPPSLSEALSDFEARVARTETAMLNRLMKMTPSAGLAWLTSLLDASAPTEGPRISDARLERILAAKLLAYPASKDPGLASTIATLAAGRLRAEKDRYVRYQLTAGLAGVGLRPTAILQNPSSAPEIVEGFAPAGETERQPAWQSSLRPVLEKDEALLRLLAEVAADPKDRAHPIALRGLAGLDSPAAAAIVLDLFARQPSTRSATLDPLLKRWDADVVRAVLDALPDEANPFLQRAMLRNLRDKPDTPGAGEALLRTIQAPGADDVATKVALLDAASSVFKAGGDRSALECVLRGFRDENDVIRDRTVSTIARSEDPRWAAPLRQAWQEEADVYRKELLTFALRKCDAAFSAPSLLWDLEMQRKRAEAARAAGRDPADAEREIEGIRLRLQELKSRRP